jgi:hypothetical protein
MLFRFRLWTRFKLALRKRPVPSARVPYGLDEFAELISSRDPSALKQLANGLAKPTELRHPLVRESDYSAYSGDLNDRNNK